MNQPATTPASNKPVPGPGVVTAKPSAVKKEPVEKKAKAPRPKKERDPNAPPRVRQPKFADELVITVFRPGAKARSAAERFKQYSTGMTVKQIIDKMAAEPFKRTAGQTQGDLRWDLRHSFIAIADSVQPIPEPPAKPAETATAPSAA